MTVYTKAPRKRKWFSVYNTDDYSFRRMTLEERKKFVMAENLKVVTVEELNDVNALLLKRLAQTIIFEHNTI